MSKKALWLWKNFVDGKPEYWAFDNPFPCHDNGDPMTLGEPCGYAIFKESKQGRFDVSSAEVIEAIKRAKPVTPPEVGGVTLAHEAAWELRKVILAYEAWSGNPYSGARAQELSVHLCSARTWLEKHDLKDLGVSSLGELSMALKKRLEIERGKSTPQKREES